jgi:hypothetical protein
MASRSLRSKRLEGLAEGEVSELPDAEEQHFNKESCEGLGQEGEPVNLGECVAGVPQDNVVSEQSPQAELLSIIWQAIQRGEEERKKEREEDQKVRLENERKFEEYRKREKEIRQKEREEDRDRLEKIKEDIVKTSELITLQFRAEIDKLNDVILSRIEKETSELSEAVASLRKGTQQQIQNVNERVGAVTKGMNEKIVAVSECVNDR